ncbi:amino acid permease-domain-containing protein [Panaeolus papilionaceus]|nr:amino acid permease-domain-containing protein [Panaeolus papilionaceus]
MVLKKSSSSQDLLAVEGIDSEQHSLLREGNVGSQTTHGAPVEEVSPLGREVTLLSAVTMNICAMVGSGIYSVPGMMYKSLGAVGPNLIFWFITPFFALAGMCVYEELASLSPLRSGAEVVYLEQAYPKPRYLFPLVYAMTNILSGPSIVVIFAQYFLSAIELPITQFNQSVAYLLTVLLIATCASLSTKFTLRLINLMTILKVACLLFVVVSGIAVFTGLTSVKDPYVNFREPFRGGTTNLNALSLSFVKCKHAFDGWNYSYAVMTEYKSATPIRIAKKANRISLLIVASLLFFINVAYAAAIPLADMEQSGSLIAALFFRNIYGEMGTKILNLVVATSCFGAYTVSLLGAGRVLREVARQGLLPYPKFFASVEPFGTPMRPIFLQASFVILMLLLLPARDAFNFLVDLASYPRLSFHAALSVGVWVLRRRRQKEGVVAPREYRAWNFTIGAYFGACVFMLVFPWIPPEENRGDVSFWYAAYCVAGIAFLLFCGLYYWVWMVALPKIFGYELVEVVEESSHGERNTKLIRRYKTDPQDEAQPLLHSRTGD